MSLVRVTSRLDGVSVTRYAWGMREAGESVEDFMARWLPPDLVGLPYVDMEEDELPPYDDKRHAWRVRNGQVVVAPEIPDPPDPREARAAAVEQATTLQRLRSAIADDIRAGRP
jgi:hypothetical protein